MVDNMDTVRWGVERVKYMLKRVPFVVGLWKACRKTAGAFRAAVSIIRRKGLVETLRGFGLLQLYARLRKLKVPAELYKEEYYLGQGGCEGVEEFKDYYGEKLSKRLASVLDEIQDIDGHRFLDLGCGRGEILLHLERTASHVVGIDYSAAAVEISRTIAKKSEVIQADVVRFLPQLQTEPFDGILMIDIAEHLFDWELEIVFKHVDRLLKPQGCLYIDTPLIPDRPYSEMHVNIKQDAKQYLRFLPDFTIEKEMLTDPRGSNYLIILSKRGDCA